MEREEEEEEGSHEISFPLITPERLDREFSL